MSSLKFSLSGLSRLRPFEESSEDGLVNEKLHQSPLILITYVAAMLSIWLGVGLGLADLEDYSAKFILMGLGASAVAAGLEWNAGLKARAMNQLFQSVIFTSLWAVI